MTGEQTYEIEPRRGEPPVRCQNCGMEIEAWACVVINGLSGGYRWRHIHDGLDICPRTPVVTQPYDHWEAGRQLWTREARDRDA